jgi:hypothetical protein
VKFLVTALWHDGLDNVEEHSLLSAALDFAKEALDCEGIVSVKVEKIKSFEEWDVDRCSLLAKANRKARFAAFDKPEDWDGSSPLS